MTSFHVSVPRDSKMRDRLLRNAWQMGFSRMRLPAVSPDIRLPTPATADHQESGNWQRLDDLVVISRRSSGAHEGVFSAQTLERGWADLIVALQVVSGSVTVVDSVNSMVLGPSMTCIRDFSTPWCFSSSADTTSRILIFPRLALLEISYERLPPFVAAGPSSPENRLLAAHLEALDAIATALSIKAAARARNATLLLVRGILDAATPTEAAVADTRCRAERYIDRHLRDPELGPGVISQAISVSPRTLHRAFAMTNETVMGYVRRRRLDQARSEISTAGRATSFASLAARWQFADAAHFSRSFRQRYGLSPAEYRKKCTIGA